MNTHRRSGFTLIEILVVVAVIGFLATFVVIAVTGRLQKARDSRRAVDWKTVKAALASYYNTNLEYPGEGPGNPTSCDSSYGLDSDNPDPVCPPRETGMSQPEGQWDVKSNFYRAIVPQYLNQLPVDPKNKLDPDIAKRKNGTSEDYYYYYEPSDNPARFCYLWRYYTEYGGRKMVDNNVDRDQDCDPLN